MCRCRVVTKEWGVAMLDLKLAAIAAAASLCVGAAGGWAIKGWQSSTALSKTKQEHAEVISHLARANAAVYKAVSAANQANQIKDSVNEKTQLAALGAEKARTDHWRNLARSKPDSVSVRLVGASCPVNHSSDDSTASSGVGHAGVEVTGSVREGVFDLRDAILEDRAKLRYFQQRERDAEANRAEAGRINGAEVSQPQISQ